MTQKPTYKQLEQRLKKLEKKLINCSRIEKSLRESEEKYRTLIEMADDAMIISKGNYRDYNKASLDLFGLSSQEQIYGKMPFDLSPPGQPNGSDSKERSMQMMEKAMAGEPQRFYWRHRKVDGTPVETEVSLSRIEVRGDPVLLSVIRDITERQQAGGAPRKSEERFRNLVDNLGDAAYEADSNGTITYVNKMAEKITETPLEDLLGKHFLPLFSEESQKVATDVFQRTLDGESPEFELTLTNGKIGHFKNEPLRDENQKIVGVFGIARDVTGHKQAQEALRESREKYRILVEKSPLGVSMIEKDGRYKYVNPKFVEMFGYTLEDIPTGREWFAKAYPDPEARNQIISTWIGDLKKSEIGEVRGRTFIVTCKDGSEKIIHFRPVTLETGNQFVIYEDITERKQAEDALKEREAALKVRTNELEEVNSALRILLKGMDEDKKKVEESVSLNVRGLVVPYAEKLRKSGLDAGQMAYLKILESNLDDVISPFAHRFSSKYYRLTPTELQIAALVRNGKTSKQIAELLSSSVRTIESHRQNIRIKIGAKNRKGNLRSLLLSMQDH
jgi:PAS domain S-box-containing protein